MNNLLAGKQAMYVLRNLKLVLHIFQWYESNWYFISSFHEIKLKMPESTKYVHRMVSRWRLIRGILPS